MSTPWKAIGPLLLSVVACSGAQPQPSPACLQDCQDGVALRALREMMKLGYNLALSGQPVGAQDHTTPCPNGGTARIFGTATSNAIQGTNDVDLTYVFTQCGYTQKDTDAVENYALTVDGTVTEKGTIAVSSATTALMFAADAITITGSVYDPASTYDAQGCALTATQNGNNVSGELCARVAGFSF